ncbi:hypothetical protein ILYODFUR_009303 [Ilyodon furcidens]|uniref:Uncharacterized protein n=1 Tax=Ilyodon furcidens TaxID=33524 RepID=A0ABV0VCH3_9TELE
MQRLNREKKRDQRDWREFSRLADCRRSPDGPLAGGWTGFAGKAESMESNGCQQSLTGNLGKEGKVGMDAARGVDIRPSVKRSSQNPASADLNGSDSAFWI